MCASILEESDAAVTKIVPLTVEQYHRMIEAAILPSAYQVVSLITVILNWKPKPWHGTSI